MPNVVEIIMKAQDQASKVMTKVESNSGQLKNSVLAHNRMIGTAMIGMGAAIAGAAVLSVKNYSSMGDEIAKMSKRTGFSTESVSELKHAAELSGTELNNLEKASRTLSGAVVDAGDGLATYVRAFDRIGLSYQQLAKLSPEQQFVKVMEALAGVEDETIRTATAADLLGARAGTTLLPMIANGVEEFKAMRNEARELGIVFDEEAAAKAEDMTDAMLRLERSIQAISLTFAEALMPILLPVVNTFTAIMKPIGQFLDANPLIQKAVGAMALGFAGLATVMGTLLILNKQLAWSITVSAGKALWAAGAYLVEAVSKVWAWAGAIPFVGVGIGLAAAAAIVGSVMAAKSSGKSLLSFKHGGIVPGLPGQPVPILAHGGERFLGSGVSTLPSTSESVININFYGPLLGNKAEAIRFTDWLIPEIRRKQRYSIGGATF